MSDVRSYIHACISPSMFLFTVPDVKAINKRKNLTNQFFAYFTNLSDSNNHNNIYITIISCCSFKISLSDNLLNFCIIQGSEMFYNFYFVFQEIKSDYKNNRKKTP